MIKFILRNKEERLIDDLPRDRYDLLNNMKGIGIRKQLSDIKLSDDEENDIGIKLYSDNDVGNHLILVLNEKNTLEEVNNICFKMLDADESVKEELEQNIIHDQYNSLPSIEKDINEMTDNLIKHRLSFYCPLVCEVVEDDGYSHDQDGTFLVDYEDEIVKAIEKVNSFDIHNMAYYFDDNKNIKEKLVKIDFGVENVEGELFGKIDFCLKDTVTSNETDIMREWVIGQCSDGWGEGFEQREIKTDESDIYVSFWNPSGKYFMYSEEEFNQHINQQSDITLGGM